MKTKLYPFLFFFALLSSCTLSGGGFYSGLKYAKVNSQKSTSTASKKENQEKQEQTFTDDHTDHSISAGETIDLATTSKLKNPAKQAGKTIANTPNKKSLPKDSCDLIYTKKGEEIYGILKEVGLTTLSYKSCDNLNGPLYVINRDEVVYIAYKNGIKLFGNF